jgi:hypothetical protein
MISSKALVPESFGIMMIVLMEFIDIRVTGMRAFDQF